MLRNVEFFSLSLIFFTDIKIYVILWIRWTWSSGCTDGIRYGIAFVFNVSTRFLVRDGHTFVDIYRNYNSHRENRKIWIEHATSRRSRVNTVTIDVSHGRKKSIMISHIFFFNFFVSELMKIQLWKLFIQYLFLYMFFGSEQNAQLVRLFLYHQFNFTLIFIRVYQFLY